MLFIKNILRKLSNSNTKYNIINANFTGFINVYIQSFICLINVIVEFREYNNQILITNKHSKLMKFIISNICTGLVNNAQGESWIDIINYQFLRGLLFYVN